MNRQQDKTFRYEIYTPDGTTCRGECVSVTMPALDGYMGVLRGRSPVTAVLRTGEITLEISPEKTESLFISHGFLQMADNCCVILAEECKPLGDLNPERAWELLQRAYRMPSDTDEQITARDEAIYDQRIRFGLAQKAHKGMMSMEAMLSRGMENLE